MVLYGHHARITTSEIVSQSSQREGTRIIVVMVGVLKYETRFLSGGSPDEPRYEKLRLMPDRSRPPASFTSSDMNKHRPHKSMSCRKRNCSCRR